MSPRVDDLLVARVWVGGLPERIEEPTLQQKFEAFGEIKWIRIHKGARDVFAFIQYNTSEEARQAMQSMDQAKDFGAGKGGVMKVQLAKPTEVERLQMERERKLGKSRSSSPSQSPSIRQQRYRSPTPSSEPSKQAQEDRKVELRKSDDARTSQGSKRGEPQTSPARCKRDEPQDDLHREDRRHDKRDERYKGRRQDDWQDDLRREGRLEERCDESHRERRRAGRSSQHNNCSDDMGRGGQQRMHQTSRSAKGSGRTFNRSRSRSLTPVLRRPFAKGKGKSTAKVQSFTVKIDNLPGDYTQEELEEAGSGFGKLLRAELVGTQRSSAHGRLSYDSIDDAVNAMKKLHGRAMEGHPRRLKAHIPCPCCGHELWD
eukprot:TRINITY_DN13623_c0_g1_i1.p1 TRINITY_DN13623_c0_g1~~TRINITY_DN13623_c0_g1_i1.p1  ORF type:complete len:386 (+),score=67.97 TRINITY_DN13623_c0_g1_i1:41-1159(+)